MCQTIVLSRWDDYDYFGYLDIFIFTYYIHFGHHPSQGMVLNDDEPMFQTIVSPGLGWWGGVTRGNGC